MSPTDVLDELGLPPDQRAIIADQERQRPFSLHWELRAMVYGGILLLSLGLGLLIYDNFDQIGHSALLAAMAIACGGCFYFAWRHRPAWSPNRVRSGSTFGDYALVLACLLFLTLEGYAQFQYTVFGTRYGLATLLPAALFLPLAYRFDHQGVLSMGLTALVSWVGVTVRPLELYFKTNFFDQPTVLSAVVLALGLIGAGLLLEQRRIKPHFTYTYLTVGGNLLLVALLGGVFNFAEARLWYVLALAGACLVMDRYARQKQFFLYLLMSVVYGYIGLTYLVLEYADLGTYGILLYFLLTGIGLVAYLLTSRKMGMTS